MKTQIRVDVFVDIGGSPRDLEPNDSNRKGMLRELEPINMTGGKTLVVYKAKVQCTRATEWPRAMTVRVGCVRAKIVRLRVGIARPGGRTPTTSGYDSQHTSRQARS